MASIIARREIEKLACEKFVARNKVREMREIDKIIFVKNDINHEQSVECRYKSMTYIYYKCLVTLPRPLQMSGNSAMARQATPLAMPILFHAAELLRHN